jgi:hypothetical protein
MAKLLTHQDLLDAQDRALGDDYLDPIKVTGDGYELVHAHAAIGERVSLAINRFETDGYILSSQGPCLATVAATFYREIDTAGAGTVLTGTLVRASRGGQVFRTIQDAEFDANDLEITVSAVSIGYGYEWNIRGPFVDPDGNTWPGELDTIDMPLMDPPFWDPTIQVRNDAAADGLGRPATIDALGDERLLRRQPNELDGNYRARIRTLPDTVSPNAIARQVKNFLRPYGVWWQLVETSEHAYQECFDAPDVPPTSYEPYDSDLFCFDDPRDPSPIRNRLLGEQDYLGAFILEVEQPPAIQDYGFVFDDPAEDLDDLTTAVGVRAFSAFDVPDTISPEALAPCLDGVDVGIDSMFARLFELLDEIKGGGVYVVIWIRERRDVPGAAATLNTLDLSPQVVTDGLPWDAILTWNEAGTVGNSGQLDLIFFDGDPAAAEVRDNERHNGVTWEAAPGVIGVRVNSSSGIDEITVGEIEAAINATSELAQVTTPDITPGKIVDGSMEGVSAVGSFSGGA